MQSKASNNKRIARNTVYLYMRMIVVLVINLYTTRILLKCLGVEDFGIYNVVGGVVSLMTFLQSSMANGFQRFFNIALGKSDNASFVKLFSVSITVQLIICALFSILAETIGLWFLNTQMTIPDERVIAANIVYQSTIIVVLLTMISAPYNALIIAYEKMNIIAVLSIIEVVFKLCAAYLLIFLDYDRLILYSVLMILVRIILLVLYATYSLKQNSKISIKPTYDKQLIKDISSFSGWNLFGSIAHSAKSQGLNIVLNMFFDPSVNAARGVAYQVSAGVTQCYHSFQTASRPQVIKYYAQEKYYEMFDLSNRISRISFMLLWIINFPLLFTADYFLGLWLGENVPPLAPVFTNIVLFTILIECFSTPISNLVHASGKMRNFQVGTSVCVLMIIPLAYFILYLGGSPESALYCSLIMAPVVQSVRIILARRVMDFSVKSYLKDAIFPCVKVSITCFAIVFFFISIGIMNMHPLQMAMFCFTIAISVIFFVGITKGERHFLLSKIRKK